MLATTDSQREAVRIVLEEFFELMPTGWINHRADAEIAEMQERQQIAKDKANKRWDMQRAGRSNAAVMPQHVNTDAAAQKTDADAMLPTPTPTPTPTPVLKNTSAIAPPDGVCDSVWSDFAELRKAKKAKLTQTAIDGIEREAVKAGWSIEDALRECCARGWTGFKADWVADRKQAPKTPHAESYREIDDRKGKERWQEMTGRIHPDLANKTVIDITPHRMELTA